MPYFQRQKRSHTRRHKAGKKQQGVAIITALLIVTLATTISITISTQLQLDVRRTGNIIATDQAHVYSLLAEETLQVILRNDDARDTFIKTLIKDGIAKQALFIDNAAISAEVTDLNACLNLNSLADGTAVSRDRLQQLFINNDLSGNLISAILDWIDPDLDNTIPDGAEDGYYMNLETPYRTAQTPLRSISELRLIKGFANDDTYKLVTELIKGTVDEDSGRFSGPSLCAFKTIHSNINININTASREVLKSLQPEITDTQLKDILQQRSDAILTRVPDVFTTQANLKLESEYYLLRSKVVIGNASKVMYSIIFWNGENTEAIFRSQRAL